MRKRTLALLAITSIAFAACGSAASNPPSTSPTTPPVTAAPTPTPETVSITDTKYAPEAGTNGGTLLIGDWQEANNFQPYYQGQVTEANVTSATFAGLIVATYDYKYAPDLATDIPTVANGGVKVPGDGSDAMTVTWTLRDGLKWSDGVDLTCADVAFTWKWILDPANTGLYGGTVGWDQITGIDCPTPTTIVEHWKTIYEGYTGIGLPLPEHYLKDIPIADQVKGAGWTPDEMPKVPTSGAFKFDSVTTGQQLKLTRNDYYKGFKSGAPAHLDSLIFKWYGDPATMITGYANKEVDIITDLLAADIPSLQAQGIPDSEISAISSLTYEFLRPNWADGTKADAATGVGGCSRNPVVADRGTGCPAGDPAFRQALAYAVNKDEINQRVLGGLEAIGQTSVAPDAYYYDKTVVAPSFNVDKANEILDTAGWVKGADGIREKNGLKAEIELCSTTRQARIDTLKLIAQQLLVVGIKAIPNNVNASDIFATYNEGNKDTPCALSHSNFDVAEHAFSVSIDPIGNYPTYHSSQFEPTGSNDAQVSDPDLDAALTAVSTTVDFVAVKKAMATFQKVYVDKTVEIPLYFRKQVDTVSPTVGNFFGNPTSAGPTWNAVDWYVKG